eukprot:CAMPEP_0172635004 /NCGR_PEP_ID=MMETSP1068-20121228/197127_1 /TAXON_ID=35684 /ORGANISM="Pseudopedinella elastica, Strain CCMP716" /LENGTH=41 /DNA_ID= /DNA_START= /DNA_END= /DNA_ORIENTATION=
MGGSTEGDAAPGKAVLRLATSEGFVLTRSSIGEARNPRHRT